MTLKKLPVLLLGLVFLFGTTAVATAQQAKQPCAAKPMAKPKTATGKVKAVSQDSLVVEVGKKELAFAISGGAAEATQKLAVGDRVTVSYTVADGKMTATKVTHKGMKAEKKAMKAGQPCAAKQPCAAPKK